MGEPETNPTEALPTPGTRVSRFLSWFTSPFGATIAWVCGPLGIALAIIFPMVTRARRELVYFPNPAGAVVVQSGAVSRLATTYDGKPITSDITATQIAIWNGGNQVIRPEHVLQPITLSVEGQIPILEATVRQTTRDVVGVAIDTSAIQRGLVGVSWKILEPGDGTIIQIVYGGQPGATIHGNGVLEGQRAIRLAIPPPRQEPPVGIWHHGDLKLLLVLLVGSSGFYVLLRYISHIAKKRKVANAVVGFFLVSAMVLLLGALIFETIIVPDAPPPFPF